MSPRKQYFIITKSGSRVEYSHRTLERLAQDFLDGKYTEDDQLEEIVGGTTTTTVLGNVLLFKIAENGSTYSLSAIRKHLHAYCGNPIQQNELKPSDRLANAGGGRLREHAFFCLYDAFISTRTTSYQFAEQLSAEACKQGLRPLYVAQDRLTGVCDWEPQINATIEVSRCLISLYYNNPEEDSADPDSDYCKAERQYAERVGKQIHSACVKYDPRWIAQMCYGNTARNVPKYPEVLSEKKWRELFARIRQTNAYCPQARPTFAEQFKTALRNARVFVNRTMELTPVLLVPMVAILVAMLAVVLLLLYRLAIVPTGAEVDHIVYYSDISGLKATGYAGVRSLALNLDSSPSGAADGEAALPHGDRAFSEPVTSESLHTGAMQLDDVWPQLRQQITQNRRLELLPNDRFKRELSNLLHAKMAPGFVVNYAARFPEITLDNRKTITVALDSIVRELCGEAGSPIHAVSKHNDWALIYSQPRSTIVLLAQPVGEKLRHETVQHKSDEKSQSILANISSNLVEDVASSSFVFVSGLPLLQENNGTTVPKTVLLADENKLDSLLSSAPVNDVMLYTITQSKSLPEKEWLARVKSSIKELRSKNKSLVFYLLPQIQ